MRHEAAKIAADDAVPGRALSLVKLFCWQSAGFHCSGDGVGFDGRSSSWLCMGTDCALDVLGDILRLGLVSLGGFFLSQGKMVECPHEPFQW